jgi:hypothetical protein
MAPALILQLALNIINTGCNDEIFADKPNAFCGKQTQIGTTPEAEFACGLKFE